MSELDRLRAEAKRRRAAATKKIARMRREKGVDITGTQYDPRRNAKLLDKYNSTQVRAYLRALDAFQSRNVGYVAGAGGVPLPKTAWQRYKSIENKFNKLGRKNAEGIDNVKLPGRGMTVRERKDTIVPTRKSAAGDAANTPFYNKNLSPESVKSVAALERLMRSFQKKLDPKYLPQAIRKARRQANEMMDAAGFGGFKSRLKRLSQHQFDSLWNHSDFATRASQYYESWLKRMGGNVERYQDGFEENAAFDLEELIEWAETLPRTAPK